MTDRDFFERIRTVFEKEADLNIERKFALKNVEDQSDREGYSSFFSSSSKRNMDKKY